MHYQGVISVKIEVHKLSFSQIFIAQMLLCRKKKTLLFAEDWYRRSNQFKYKSAVLNILLFVGNVRE